MRSLSVEALALFLAQTQAAFRKSLMMTTVLVHSPRSKTRQFGRGRDRVTSLGGKRDPGMIPQDSLSSRLRDRSGTPDLATEKSTMDWDGPVGLPQRPCSKMPVQGNASREIRLTGWRSGCLSVD